MAGRLSTWLNPEEKKDAVCNKDHQTSAAQTR
jgi:hypothetical protein